MRSSIVYRKCPKCGLAILMSGSSFTLINQPKPNGYLHNLWSIPVVVCPKCQHIDLIRNFAETPKPKTRTENDIRMDRSSVDVRYEWYINLLRNEHRYKELAEVYLNCCHVKSLDKRTNYVYTPSNDKYLKKSIEYHIKSLTSEVLKLYDKIKLLESALNLCTLTKDAKQYRELKKIGNDDGLIIKSHDEFFKMKPPYPQNKDYKPRYIGENLKPSIAKDMALEQAKEGHYFYVFHAYKRLGDFKGIGKLLEKYTIYRILIGYPDRQHVLKALWSSSKLVKFADKLTESGRSIVAQELYEDAGIDWTDVPTRIERILGIK